MKRLVVCCDGTWMASDSVDVSNIEKIARSVDASSANVPQVVHYASGVGARGYGLDRLLGGAFGSGLIGNLTETYRFLALNYEPGDEIFVFGFSRGAYTARSLVGMLGRVGLLRARSLNRGRLREAVLRYRKMPLDKLAAGASDAEFARDWSHKDVQVRFLGVFDTVGALGIPGPLQRKHRFHDVELGGLVLTARQALAADERRRDFEPSLWRQGPDTTSDVKQVWFEGVHSDVGGGYPETGLADTALLWMVREARAQGLGFDLDSLADHLNTGSPALRHDSMRMLYRVSNVVRRVIPGGSSTGRFRRGARVFDLQNERLSDLAVRVATSALQHWEDDPGYQQAALNIGWWMDEQTGSADLEPVTALPEPSSTVVDMLA